MTDDDRPAYKFDPAKAENLDVAARDDYLPPERLIGELALGGGETVVDYGAGTGYLTGPLATAVGERGRVLAVDESEPMVDRLRAAVRGVPAVETLLITDNHVPVTDASVAGILAVNLLHEIRGEGALAEMRRVLAPRGRLVVADWRPGVPDRPSGPPDDALYTPESAADELRRWGFAVREAARPPYHYVLVATLADDGDG